MTTQNCPYCRESIADTNSHACPACRTPHHRDCWEENGGCTVFGCEHAPVEEAKIAVTMGELNSGRPGAVTQLSAGGSYFVAREGQQLGPYTTDEINRYLGEGRVVTDDLVWREGMAAWRPIREVLIPVSIAARTAVPPPLSQVYRPSAAKQPDPCEGRLRFGRGMYVLCIIGIMILAGVFSANKDTEPIGLLILWAWSLTIGTLRLRDIGYSGWTVLLSFIPIGNIIIGWRMLTNPRGYAIHKTPDTAMKAVQWTLVGGIALIVLLGIIGAIVDK